MATTRPAGATTRPAGNPIPGFAGLAPLAEGLDVLIRFHDREIDRDLLEGLHRHDVMAGLALLMPGAASRLALRDLAAALEQVGLDPAPATLDDLAAEYADLFLTHGYRVSPSGSVWLTEDRLERQIPMFDVREWYDHYGVSVPNWRVRPDDHLVHELQFLSHLAQMGSEVPATDMARFLDLHVLPWLPEFCRKAEDRVRAPLYVALLRLTRHYLDDLRDGLEDLTGLPRAVRACPGQAAPQTADGPAPYVPGVAESW
jgi:TorA maturation chaperone TorD